MHVITRRRLVEFGKLHPQARRPLDIWYRLMKHSDLATPDGTKALFGSADFLGKNVTVFDIGGNKYRLSATMRYDMQRVFIRQVMTHAEYVRRSADGTL